MNSSGSRWNAGGYGGGRILEDGLRLNGPTQHSEIQWTFLGSLFCTFTFLPRIMLMPLDVGYARRADGMLQPMWQILLGKQTAGRTGKQREASEPSRPRKQQKTWQAYSIQSVIICVPLPKLWGELGKGLHWVFFFTRLILIEFIQYWDSMILWCIKDTYCTCTNQHWDRCMNPFARVRTRRQNA